MIDTNPEQGISYYRLKQIDHNGSFEHSNIISVSHSLEKNVSFIVYPNPNHGEFTVDFSGIENNHEIEIEMYSVEGKLVYKNTIQSQSAITNTVQIIPTEKISTGQYIVNFIAEGIKYPVQVIVN
jgi:hypothetical protein